MQVLFVSMHKDLLEWIIDLSLFPILSLEFREYEFIICYKNNTSMSHLLF